MPVLFHGYPQHPDSHPTRPWWRKAWRTRDDGTRYQYGWERGDGAVEHCGPLSDADALIAECDNDSPMPAPDPKCGQVWVYRGEEETVSSVSADGVAKFPGTDGGPWLAFEWPPVKGVLVYGPGSPWQGE